MPTLPVIAIFYCDCIQGQEWIKFRYADETTSKPFAFDMISVIVAMAKDMESWEWATLQVALKAPNNWVEVSL